MIMIDNFYVACWHDDSPSPYRYFGGITSNRKKAECWLAEAKAKFPEEEWVLCHYYG